MGIFFASAAVAPQGASRWHLNQIYCECEAFTVKPRRVCRPQAAKKLESFSAGACTWQKIPLRLQVWNLFACGEQIMRAAACKTLSESPGTAGAQSVKKPRRVRCVSSERDSIIFCRGAPQGGFSCPFGAIHLLYLAENSSQAASVEFVRLRRTNYARGRLQKTAQKPQRGFSTV